MDTFAPLKLKNMKQDILNKGLLVDSDEVIQGKGQNIIPPPKKEPLWKAYL